MTTQSDAATATSPQPILRTLTTRKVIVLIIAAMTPLAALASMIPLGLAFGGPSTTWAFILVGVIIGLFCVGYAAMAQRINRPGAFYGYITRGLGRKIGVAAGFIALVGYWVGLIATTGVQTAVMQEGFRGAFGLDLPWQVYLFVIPLLVGVLAYRKIDLSAAVVGVVVVLEIAVVVALVIAIVVQNGFTSTFPAEVLSFDVFSQGQWTVAFVFAILCFQGYEAGAMYAPEAIRPEKTIPRALFGALAILVIFYVIATWALIGSVSIDGLMPALEAAEIVGFVFATVGTYLGPVGLWLFSLLTIFAQFAVLLALVNFMPRYVQSLAADGLLPDFLARKNKFGVPGAAQITMAGSAVVIVFVLSLVGIDPFTQVSTVGFGIGAISATVLMAIASLAVIGYFLKQPKAGRNIWTTMVAPAVSFVLLLAALVIELNSFTWITGNPEPWTAVLPWIVLIVGVLGLVYAVVLQKVNPRVYQDLGAGDSAEEAESLREVRLTETAAIRLARKG